jgi:hypothetical protein
MARIQPKRLGLLLGASVLFAAGCASTAGWGPLRRPRLPRSRHSKGLRGSSRQPG